MSLEGGARLPLLLVAGAPLFLWAFVRWEQRIRRRGHPPLLDVALLRELPGYGNGLAVGALYFTGFTGVFLVLSVFLQEGMDLSPLHTGLLLTPFAMGSAVTAPIAGRIVSAIGRRVTVVALVVMMTGILLVALLVPGRDVGTLGWFLVPALVLAGLGGGGVVNPNFTLSLAEVPPHMGGAAGGALQTGQRIGSSIGAALLMTVYQVTEGSASTGRALQAALLTALVVLGLALVMAFRAAARADGAATVTVQLTTDAPGMVAALAVLGTVAGASLGALFEHYLQWQRGKLPFLGRRLGRYLFIPVFGVVVLIARNALGGGSDFAGFIVGIIAGSCGMGVAWSGPGPRQRFGRPTNARGGAGELGVLAAVRGLLLDRQRGRRHVEVALQDLGQDRGLASTCARRRERRVAPMAAREVRR